jgi:hypothetical protein
VIVYKRGGGECLILGCNRYKRGGSVLYSGVLSSEVYGIAWNIY